MKKKQNLKKKTKIRISTILIAGFILIGVIAGAYMLFFALSLPDLSEYYHCRDVLLPDCVGDDVELRSGGIYVNNTYWGICSCYNVTSDEFIDEIIH